ncbi:MAG: hypothetical protein JWP86_375 [Phenylobacterium sp.]|nr:hypothetical protein [Phenylobacterium sp.]MDB5493038.1 hypothetical protein [Phenylobacterium sp.]
MHTSRKLLLAGGAAIVATAMASSAFAQASATTSATASITVFQPITITKNSDLTFGRVIRTSSTPTIFTVSAANGGTSTSGGNGIFTSGGGTPARATFTVNGEGGQAFNILSDATVVANGNTINLVAQGFGAPVSTTNTSTGTISGTLGSSGSTTFGVGGNVTLSSTSPTGVASGSFNVTVTYQ